MTSQEIKELRKSMSLTQIQFASKVGVTLGTVWNWEHGIEPMGVFKEKLELLKKAHDKKGT